jgi:chromosome segregation ATPase
MTAEPQVIRPPEWLNENNAAVAALKQTLEALIHKRDRAREELETIRKRRELLLDEIDGCSRGINEVIEALSKLRARE